MSPTANPSFFAAMTWPHSWAKDRPCIYGGLQDVTETAFLSWLQHLNDCLLRNCALTWMRSFTTVLNVREMGIQLVSFLIAKIIPPKNCARHPRELQRVTFSSRTSFFLKSGSEVFALAKNNSIPSSGSPLLHIGIVIVVFGVPLITLSNLSQHRAGPRKL